VEGSLSFEPPMLFAAGVLFLFKPSALFRPDAGVVPATTKYSGHLLRGGALPLRAGAGCGLRIMAGVLLAAEMDRQMYDLKLATWHFWLSRSS